jgi:Bifunctional DNA primase/polymerase, N-terminal/Primase C terminal 1 (PriCT-1)
MLDAALGYVRLGLPVFPIWTVLPSLAGGTYICGCGRYPCKDAGKHPMARLAPHGFKDATTDEDLVKHWWASAPNANVGIATGRSCTVLDVDPRHGGDRTLAKLEQQRGLLPNTWRVRTGGGGTHVYFTANVDVRNSAGKIGEGLDVRGDGGYVIAPPSLHVSGNHYAWQSPPDATALAALPAWLLTTAPAAKFATPVTSWRALVKHGVGEGRRNDAVARLAGHLLRRYVDPLVTLDLMISWNVTHCRPPLEQDEVVRIVDNIATKELKRREAA